jgi:hypothetical protein
MNTLHREHNTLAAVFSTIVLQIAQQSSVTDSRHHACMRVCEPNQSGRGGRATTLNNAHVQLSLVHHWMSDDTVRANSEVKHDHA